VTKATKSALLRPIDLQMIVWDETGKQGHQPMVQALGEYRMQGWKPTFAFCTLWRTPSPSRSQLTTVYSRDTHDLLVPETGRHSKSLGYGRWLVIGEALRR